MRLAAQSYLTRPTRGRVMNDYAHLRLHEATIRGTVRNARHQRSSRRLAVLGRRRDAKHRAGAAGHASQVSPA